MKKNILNLIPFIITIGCFMAYSIIGDKILPDGTLVEPFFLIPTAWAFFFMGIIGLIIRGIHHFKTKDAE